MEDNDRCLSSLPFFISLSAASSHWSRHIKLDSDPTPESMLGSLSSMLLPMTSAADFLFNFFQRFFIFSFILFKLSPLSPLCPLLPMFSSSPLPLPHGAPQAPQSDPHVPHICHRAILTLAAQSCLTPSAHARRPKTHIWQLIFFNQHQENF